MSFVVFSLCASVALLALGMSLGREMRERAERERVEQETLLGLQQAAIDLELTLPERKDEGWFVCRGELHGMRATMEIAGRGMHRVAVAVTVVGLPAEVMIGPRPRGRDQEMFALGGAIETGVAEFDRNFALFGNGVAGDALVALAQQIPRELVELVAERFDPLSRVTLTATELVVNPGWPTLAWSGPHSPRWHASQINLVHMWRSAERLVKEGVERGVFLRVG